jgi:hypothetical protein
MRATWLADMPMGARILCAPSGKPKEVKRIFTALVQVTFYNRETGLIFINDLEV